MSKLQFTKRRQLIAAAICTSGAVASAASTDQQSDVLNTDDTVLVDSLRLPGDRDDTESLQRGMDLVRSSRVRRLELKSRRYLCSRSILIASGVHLVGVSSLQGRGTRIDYIGATGPLFISAENDYVAAVSFENLEVIHSNNEPGKVGEVSAFRMYGVTNNSRFKNLLIRNFSGTAFEIYRQTLVPRDRTAAQNVLFEQVFVVSCGGYAFDIRGYVNATWLMCDLNSCVTGYFRFQEGSSNQCVINIFGLWVEGTRQWSAKIVFEMFDTKSQLLNLIGCNFTLALGVRNAAIVKSYVTSCRPNTMLCTGYGYDYLHIDVDPSSPIKFEASDSAITKMTVSDMTVSGAAPKLSINRRNGKSSDQSAFQMILKSTLQMLLSTNGQSPETVVELCANKHAPTLKTDLVLSRRGLAISEMEPPNGVGRVVGKIKVFDEAGRPIGYIDVNES